MGLGALFGGLTFALYPLCVAHTNDHMEPEPRIAASGGLILLYSIGSALGPVTAAVAMKLAGPPGLFVSIALGGGAALVFAFWRSDGHTSEVQSLLRISSGVVSLESK